MSNRLTENHPRVANAEDMTVEIILQALPSDAQDALISLHPASDVPDVLIVFLPPLDVPAVLPLGSRSRYCSRPKLVRE